MTRGPIPVVMPEMAKTDYYELLGVSRECSDADLKSAFRKAAMQHHPDRNPGDKDAEIKFKEINEAYQCLSDKDKRAAYDRFGHAAFENGGGGPGGFGPDFASSMSDIFEDIFGDVFGNGGRRGGGHLVVRIAVRCAVDRSGAGADRRGLRAGLLQHLLNDGLGLLRAPRLGGRRPRGGPLGALPAWPGLAGAG